MRSYSCHFFALLGASLTGSSTALAMLHFKLAAFLSAGTANFCAGTA
ncbi:hypothetical protein Cflav_PD4728 [Pedosphaera parvula Ellin514]|uniref:Uncharacterized protein n=1 Tax=Pedosphaera parvula (strain Ellin514) TaxID=320771 RepID=B9XEH4_PEDPL|nr:hypothetical protein Cflav_PD4728 [Pedosphaera parvula Ellin514]